MGKSNRIYKAKKKEKTRLHQERLRDANANVNANNSAGGGSVASIAPLGLDRHYILEIKVRRNSCSVRNNAYYCE
jgi:hypothetical protein